MRVAAFNTVSNSFGKRAIPPSNFETIAWYVARLRQACQQIATTVPAVVASPAGLSLFGHNEEEHMRSARSLAATLLTLALVIGAALGVAQAQQGKPQGAE